MTGNEPATLEIVRNSASACTGASLGTMASGSGVFEGSGRPDAELSGYLNAAGVARPAELMSATGCAVPGDAPPPE